MTTSHRERVQFCLTETHINTNTSLTSTAVAARWFRPWISPEWWNPVLLRPRLRRPGRQRSGSTPGAGAAAAGSRRCFAPPPGSAAGTCSGPGPALPRGHAGPPPPLHRSWQRTPLRGRRTEPDRERRRVKSAITAVSNRTCSHGNASLCSTHAYICVLSPRRRWLDGDRTGRCVCAPS